MMFPSLIKGQGNNCIIRLVLPSILCATRAHTAAVVRTGGILMNVYSLIHACHHVANVLTD